MALKGGTSKGYGHSNSSGNRGRAYGILLLLAFGAAVLGVMLLHKLRERRVFDLLLRDKDRELLSLQYLLQKQRITTKEAKRKMEEMKAKIFSLRTQKTQLNNRIGDMQSVTTSLKQEHMALESALEKLQNENRVLRVKDVSSDRENPEMIALRELLKQKESEIQEMKLRLEKPTQIWSVSADDPSKPPVNLATTGTTVEENENEVSMSKEENVTAEYQQLQESMNVKDGQNSTDRNGAENGTAVEGGNKTVISREELLKILDDNPVGENTTQRGASMLDSTQRGDNGENNADEHQGEGQIEGGGESVKPKVSQEDGDPKVRDQSNGNQVKKDENSHDGEHLKVGDGEVIKDDHGAIRDGELQKPKNPQDSDGQEHNVISKGEMKLEVKPDVSQIGATSRARSRSRSKKGQRRRRMISKKRELEKSGNSKEALRDGHDQENAVIREEQGGGHSEMPDEPKNEVLGITTNTENQEALEGGEGADSNTRRVEIGLIGKDGMGISSESELLKPHDPQHHEDAESNDTADGIGKEQETSQLKPQESEDGEEGLTMDSIKSEAGQLADDAIEQKLDVGRPQEDQEESTDTSNEIGKEQETSQLKPRESEDGREGLTIEQKLDVGRLQEDQEASAVKKLEDRGATGKDADRNEEAENMEVDSAGEQTEKNAETEDDNPSVLDLELDDIEEHGHENTTEEEEF
ncbi:uncharacterized protein DDB_G0290685-like [Macadamia integrifolia]|uniref:uncharacterized protein DDB_G0290685-like n=1 Tax=Macadamia integrifolia TaxID=60698 RepID=UPI001C52BBB0|nr:uncharacterized protein DDB_G0290685-like [Macadamia integrifolia]